MIAMPNSGNRTEKFAFGIADVSLGEISREIPSDEPPPLAPNANLAVIGKQVSRVGGRAMVTGTARYTVDVKLPGMLYARILRSPYAHARVRSINTGAAERYPGVRAVHVMTERGAHASGDTVRRPLPTVRYAGASIAAVAATSRTAADAATRLITVDYEMLPFVVDMDAARQPGAPHALEDEGRRTQATNGNDPANVRGPTTASAYGGRRGDIAQGFRDADLVVEGEFRTQVQTHCCLEPHAIVADWQADRLTVYTSTQATVAVRNDLAAAFGLAHDRVHVITEYMGGGFGSKLGIGDYGFIAVELSRKAGAPVSLVFDRSEEQQASGNRPSTWQQLRIGARHDSRLTGVSLLPMAPPES